MAPMKLSPSQERAVEALRHDWPDTDAFVLWAPYGLGRSTMLRAVQKERGGIVLDMASYLERLADAEPLALEETLHQLLPEEGLPERAARGGRGVCAREGAQTGLHDAGLDASTDRWSRPLPGI